MRQVILETRHGVDWVRFGSVSEVEPPGSLSSDEPAGRQVYLFGWLPDGEAPGVWRSTDGIALENPAVRQVVTISLDRLADLGHGSHERDLYRPGGRVAVRFRLET